MGMLCLGWSNRVSGETSEATLLSFGVAMTNVRVEFQEHPLWDEFVKWREEYFTMMQVHTGNYFILPVNIINIAWYAFLRGVELGRKDVQIT